MLLEEIQNKYKTFKQKDGDNLLIKIGVLGVLIGWLLSMPFLKHFFAWFILFGVGIKLYEYVREAQKRFVNKEEENQTVAQDIQGKWATFRANKGENLLIKIGVIGVLIGWIFSIAFLNQFFAWFILFGVAIKLYDYVFDSKSNSAVTK